MDQTREGRVKKDVSARKMSTSESWKSAIEQKAEKDSQILYRQRLTEGFQARIESLEKAFADNTSSLTEIHEAEIAKLKAAHVQEMIALKTSNENNTITLKAAHKESLTRETSEIYTISQTKYENMKKTLKDDHEREMKKVQAENSRLSLAKTKQTIQDLSTMKQILQLTTEKDRLKNGIRDIKARHEQAFESYRQKCAKTPDSLVKFYCRNKSGKKLREKYAYRYTEFRKAMSETLCKDSDINKDVDLLQFEFRKKVMTRDELQKSLHELEFKDGEEVEYQFLAKKGSGDQSASQSASKKPDCDLTKA